MVGKNAPKIWENVIYIEYVRFQMDFSSLIEWHEHWLKYKPNLNDNIFYLPIGTYKS